MKNVQGYDVQNVHNIHVVSVKEGAEIRARQLKQDKRLLGVFSWYTPLVNPESYTDAERAYMENVNDT